MHVIWDLGDTLITRPPGGQDLRPLTEYPEIQLRAGARPALERLAARGCRHAVLSNTAASTSADVRRLLRRLGVLDWFDVVMAPRPSWIRRAPASPMPPYSTRCWLRGAIRPPRRGIRQTPGRLLRGAMW